LAGIISSKLVFKLAVNSKAKKCGGYTIAYTRRKPVQVFAAKAQSRKAKYILDLMQHIKSNGL